MFLILGCLAAAALAGCGSSGGSNSSASTTSGSSGSTGAAESSGGKEVSVAMVETFSAIPFYVSAKNGAEEAAKSFGPVNLTIQAPTTPNGTNEATMAANLLAEEPEGFGPNPCILPAWTRVLKEMSEQVPNENVISWGCTPIAEPGQSSPIKTFVGVDDRESGRATAELTIEEAGLDGSTTGTALISACEEGVPILDGRREGTEEVIKKMLPKVRIDTFATSSSEQSKTTATWTSEVSNNPDVVFAMGPCDTDQAALLTVKKKNPSDFAVATIDPNQEEAEAIEAGTFTAGVSTAPWSVGYVTVGLLAEGARGTAAPEGWVDTGLLPITKSNAAEFAKAAASTTGQSAVFKPVAEKALKAATSGSNVKPLEAAFE